MQIVHHPHNYTAKNGNVSGGPLHVTPSLQVFLSVSNKNLYGAANRMNLIAITSLTKMSGATIS